MRRPLVISYMTLLPIPSEFPYTVYEENFIFFLSVHCMACIKLNNNAGPLRIRHNLASINCKKWPFIDEIGLRYGYLCQKHHFPKISCGCKVRSPVFPPGCLHCTVHSTEPVFVNLLRSPGIDFQPGGQVRPLPRWARQPYIWRIGPLGYIGWLNRFLGIDSWSP